MNKLLLIFIFTIIQVQARIIETDTIQSLSNEITSDCIVFFDIDETLITKQTHFGSDIWWEYFQGYPMEVKLNTIQSVFAAACKSPNQLVEVDSIPFIQSLQNQNIPVYGLTARFKNTFFAPQFDKFTYDELRNIGICFNELEEYGIIFTSHLPKGPFLLNYLNTLTNKPSKIIVIDDNLSQVQSIDTTLENQYDCVCFHYQRKNRIPFNPLIANVQLQHLVENDTILSNEEALEIASTQNITNPHFYLESYQK